ncbi:serine/threonine-protein kinase [Stieleria varia]|uniref:non-specific serine/threonine protein kinase n=1 Tax=Stieleria varia TaxID=2528005 RepID=A0A5C6B2D5_9BACT|nr:serine/threonine-protein kinase [Stieleria varia]TWU06303.1 Serine/threonine-protein kinase PknB [Stieleria varia]
MIARFHYDDDTLQKLLEDDISDLQDELSHHVETCPQCQDRLEEITQRGLTWQEAGEMLRENQLVGESLRDSQFSASPRNATTYFLSPSDRQDSLGRFGRYEIMEVLGRGGMGIVMRGFDPELNRYSAVKVLAPELASSAAARKRFSREAKSAAAVVHPHVVPIQTVDQHGGLPYLVMPVVEGQSLQQRVEHDGPLPIIEVVRIAAQIADGLAAAHAQGLVHRDIKPANILLENGVERVQITDFGLARAADDASMTRSGVIAGTPQYMSPEQAHGDEVDQRSDLFSLGSVMYFMLTGRSPFRAETTMGVLSRIANDQPRPLRSIRPETPAWLEQVVFKLLAKLPQDRYVSAEQSKDLLADCLAHLQQPTAIPLPGGVPAFDAQRHPAAGNSVLSRLKVGHQRGKFFALAGLAFSLVLAGLLIVLEFNKGTLTIESEVDDVQIRVLQGSKVAEQLTVSRQGNQVRLAAGEYVVEIDGQMDGIDVVDGDVTLTRGGAAIVKIMDSRSKSVQDAVHPELDAVDTANTQPEIVHDRPNQNGIGFNDGYERYVQIQEPTTSGGSPTSLAPPSDEQILKVLKEKSLFPSGIPSVYEISRDVQRIVKEKTADYVDPTGMYPLIGKARMHHAHYKCSVYFDENADLTYPVTHSVKNGTRVAVIYIDQTHLHKIDDAEPVADSIDLAAAPEKALQSSVIDFTTVSNLRTKLQQADQRVNQVTQSIRVWEERVEMWEKNPEGRVDGEDVPNSDSMEDALASLESVKDQLATLLRDREFLHREVTSRFVILRKQAEIAKGELILAQSEIDTLKRLYRQGIVAKHEMDKKQQAAAKASLELTRLDKLVEQYISIVREFSLSGSAGRNSQREQSVDNADPFASRGTMQVLFQGPENARAVLKTKDGREIAFPERVNLRSGEMYAFSLSHVPGYPDLRLSGAIGLSNVSVQALAQAQAYYDYNAIPIQITNADIEACKNGISVTKVVYLPRSQEFTAVFSPVETLDSKRIDPGIDVVAEAERLGVLLAVLKLDKSSEPND